MISKGEIDAYGFTEHYFTLAHKAAMHGRLSVLKFLIKEGNLPLVALQQPDDSLTTPAMLAIQVCPPMIQYNQEHLHSVWLINAYTKTDIIKLFCTIFRVDIWNACSGW